MSSKDNNAALNMDRSKRVVIETEKLAWSNSPSVGVSRKKLERQAAESGQVTIPSEIYQIFF